MYIYIYLYLYLYLLNIDSWVTHKHLRWPLPKLLKPNARCDLRRCAVESMDGFFPEDYFPRGICPMGFDLASSGWSFSVYFCIPLVIEFEPYSSQPYIIFMYLTVLTVPQIHEPSKNLIMLGGNRPQMCLLLIPKSLLRLR